MRGKYGPDALQPGALAMHSLDIPARGVVAEVHINARAYYLLSCYHLAPATAFTKAYRAGKRPQRYRCRACALLLDEAAKRNERVA